MLWCSDPPPVLLVGHSMGGSVAVWSAAAKAVAPLAGVVVIDVVEGTALAALPHMKVGCQRVNDPLKKY